MKCWETGCLTDVYMNRVFVNGFQYDVMMSSRVTKFLVIMVSGNRFRISYGYKHHINKIRQVDIDTVKPTRILVSKFS